MYIAISTVKKIEEEAIVSLDILLGKKEHPIEQVALV